MGIFARVWIGIRRSLLLPDSVPAKPIWYVKATSLRGGAGEFPNGKADCLLTSQFVAMGEVVAHVTRDRWTY